jgi:hypothetical protein
MHLLCSKIVSVERRARYLTEQLLVHDTLQASWTSFSTQQVRTLSRAGVRSHVPCDRHGRSCHTKTVDIDCCGSPCVEWSMVGSRRQECRPRCFPCSAQWQRQKSAILPLEKTCSEVQRCLRSGSTVVVPLTWCHFHQSRATPILVHENVCTFNDQIIVDALPDYEVHKPAPT